MDFGICRWHLASAGRAAQRPDSCLVLPFGNDRGTAAFDRRNGMFYEIVMLRDGDGAGTNLFGYIRRHEKQEVPVETKMRAMFGCLLTRTFILSSPKPASVVNSLYNDKLDADYHSILRGISRTINTDLTEKQIETKMRKLVESIPDGGDLKPYAFDDLLRNIGDKASLLAAENLNKAVSGLRSAGPSWIF